MTIAVAAMHCSSAPPPANSGRNSGDVSVSKIIKGKRKREKEVRLEPKLPDGMPHFRYEPYIVIGKRHPPTDDSAAPAGAGAGQKSEYVFIWDPVL